MQNRRKKGNWKPEIKTLLKRLFVSLTLLLAIPVPVSAQTACVSGMAGQYSCNKVDLLSHLSLEELGDIGRAQDNWGWKDPQTGRTSSQATALIRVRRELKNSTKYQHPFYWAPFVLVGQQGRGGDTPS
jgi:hypothetical protein